MKITKSQLRKIIKEESIKLEVSRQDPAARALGLYADANQAMALKKQMVNLIETVWGAAEDDGLEVDEASELAELALAQIVSEVARTMGMMRLEDTMQSLRSR